MSGSQDKIRLDQALVTRGLAPTRSQARDAIKRGTVILDGSVCRKASQSITANSRIEFSTPVSPYVSRGGIKLAHSLAEFSISVAGKSALDIGASTGGFTDVLLQNGAEKVYAIDVGRDQLHKKLREDVRVHSHESLNAKDVTQDHVTSPVDLIVCDVSFISLSKVLPASLALTKHNADLITLVKPQFEAGPEHIGKGGIVRDADVRAQVLQKVSLWINDQESWHVIATCASPIEGPDGNQEFLLHAARK